jgi:hypothetical protein
VSAIQFVTDPLDYFEQAIGQLPDDPREATADDLDQLTAVSEGLARLTTRLVRDMVALAHRSLYCVGDRAELVALVAERGRLELLYQNALDADRRHDRYAAAALKAHGFNLVDQSGRH